MLQLKIFSAVELSEKIYIIENDIHLYQEEWLFWCKGTCNKSTCSERVCTDPPILGHLLLPVAEGHLQQPPAAATSSNINHLQLFTTCSGHLQLFLQLTAATCSFFTTCSYQLQHTTYSSHLQRPLAAISTTCSFLQLAAATCSFFTTFGGYLQQYQPLAAMR